MGRGKGDPEGLHLPPPGIRRVPGRGLHKLGEGAVEPPPSPLPEPGPPGLQGVPQPRAGCGPAPPGRPRVSCCTPFGQNAFQAAQTAVPHQIEGRIPAAPEPELPDDMAAALSSTTPQRSTQRRAV